VLLVVAVGHAAEGSRTAAHRRGKKRQGESGSVGVWQYCLPNRLFVGKNGILPYANNVGMTCFFGIFKGTVPVIVLVNSNPPANITTIVAHAFANATVPHP
jgi:hypothetical protein